MRPKPPKILDLLNEVLEEEDRVRSLKYSGSEMRHYPSSASFKKASGAVSGACLRQLYYRATKLPETNPKEMTVKLQAGFGNAIHDWLASKLQKSDKIKVTSEAGGKVTAEGLKREISFRLDNLVSYKGELGGVEVKTKQSFYVQRMVKEGGPKDADILQVLSYFATNEAIRWFSIVYFARDTAYRAEYHIWKDEETNQFMIEGAFPESRAKPIDELNFPGVLARWKELENNLDTGIVPKRDFKVVFTKEGEVTEKRTKHHVDYKTDFQCNYCNYQTHCWTQADAIKDAYQIPGDFIIAPKGLKETK